MSDNFLFQIDTYFRIPILALAIVLVQEIRKVCPPQNNKLRLKNGWFLTIEIFTYIMSALTIYGFYFTNIMSRISSVLFIIYHILLTIYLWYYLPTCVDLNAQSSLNNLSVMLKVVVVIYIFYALAAGIFIAILRSFKMNKTQAEHLTVKPKWYQFKH